MFQNIRVISKVRPAPYVCDSCRTKVSRTRVLEQRRWITRNHIFNIRTAEEEWMARAKEINSGKKMSMLDLLEQRGYINQIVGYYIAEATLSIQR
jgi:hypothetical protein